MGLTDKVKSKLSATGGRVRHLLERVEDVVPDGTDDHLADRIEAAEELVAGLVPDEEE